jgi:ABC-type multidrug transport system ATPase subunit
MVIVDAMYSNVYIRDLSQQFGKKRVVNGISLDMDEGVLGLLGPNGAGKTTLLRTLATILPPVDGDIRLLGWDPTHPTERRQIRRRLGYLPQTLGYYPGYTVQEFVEYIALLKEIPSRDVKQAMVRAIELVGLQDKMNSKLRTLSGGMLRRVGIAQAIVNQPELLLLDEPTAGLDPEQRVDFRRILRQLGCSSTVIVSTHLVEDVGAACTEVAMMDQGSIVFRGTPDDLVRRGESYEVGDSPLERGYGSVLAEARA